MTRFLLSSVFALAIALMTVPGTAVAQKSMEHSTDTTTRAIQQNIAEQAQKSWSNLSSQEQSVVRQAAEQAGESPETFWQNKPMTERATLLNQAHTQGSTPQTGTQPQQDGTSSPQY